MPLAEPQPSWSAVAPQRSCGCCLQIAVKLAYSGGFGPTLIWVCKNCDLTGVPSPEHPPRVPPRKR